MLTQAENDRLTRVGRGTPAGELLRRYWHPVAVAQELTDEQPTLFVRLLSTSWNGPVTDVRVNFSGRVSRTA